MGFPLSDDNIGILESDHSEKSVMWSITQKYHSFFT